MVLNIHIEESTRIRNKHFFNIIKRLLYENPGIRSPVKLYLVEQTKGGPSKLLLKFF
jgi:hypothetical protein